VLYDYYQVLDKNHKNYLSKHVCPGLSHALWDNWTQEEIDYYSNTERFPFLRTNNKEKKKEEYIPLWIRETLCGLSITSGY
jgi:hypothetical protein